MIRPLAFLLGLASLAACSADPPAAANAADGVLPVGSVGGVDPATNAQFAAAPPPARGLPDTPAPHAAPELQPMVYADFAEKELLGSGCSFRTVPRGPVLLFVRDQGDGLVRFDKRLRRITAATPGREAVEDGGILAGDQVSFTVERPADRADPAADSTRQWPATLTMRTADGGERVYRGGRWECGS
ncbi:MULTISPECIES: hypothetical protein [Sphingomonas]|jgi:hypothetical protein|uniref:Lipoprotein n=1 Tax=Sphingomonas hankookensis TaxID=563996 RepID=A0ABR5YD91_9SPHN|nr:MULTISPECIES: hypothetical protein [Sphingomonas]KZE15332.1 hypothetical protein AVT10_03060 [Sphingomonas hankookensis]PZT96396.1 MAG: hypothetical protein DI625_00400 [Sphingomonas sp.]RSV30068.1 hypothetical protein CA237_08415 [Sphingomonas sp. ABOLH]WCP71026.1 hypothetical protein PPZ50_11680 [Sphingomonas hankookensis]